LVEIALGTPNLTLRKLGKSALGLVSKDLPSRHPLKILPRQLKVEGPLVVGLVGLGLGSKHLKIMKGRRFGLVELLQLGF
jgi:hypothetical protein